jgi:23S rRNA (cytosine1962-C5)-methyltransferase
MTLSNIPLFITESWNDYALLDSGLGLKLEKFGNIITIRPEPQAIWNPFKSLDEWKHSAHLEYYGTSPTNGKWVKHKPSSDNWLVSFPLNHNEKLSIELALTSFKHVGIFPEQHHNWLQIYNTLRKLDKPNFLNLFAYTGAASLAAAAAGANVYHVDSIKQVLSWANRNREHNKLASNIHWVLDDALKFAKRELKREKKFQGIILDPPAFGHGPKGESWKLEKNLPELLNITIELLDPHHPFLILNTYSLGYSAIILYNLVQQILDAKPHINAKINAGELCLKDQYGRILPLGICITLTPALQT